MTKYIAVLLCSECILGDFSLQQVDNYWKRSLFPCSLNLKQTSSGRMERGLEVLPKLRLFIVVERKAALHEDMKYS